MSAVVQFPATDEDRARTAAARAAFLRAIRLGYSRTTAHALRRTASRDWIRGEAPEETAVRIVRLAHEPMGEKS